MPFEDLDEHLASLGYASGVARSDALRLDPYLRAGGGTNALPRRARWGPRAQRTALAALLDLEPGAPPRAAQR